MVNQERLENIRKLIARFFVTFVVAFIWLRPEAPLGSRNLLHFCRGPGWSVVPQLSNGRKPMRTAGLSGVTR